MQALPQLRLSPLEHRESLLTIFHRFPEHRVQLHLAAFLSTINLNLVLVEPLAEGPENSIEAVMAHFQSRLSVVAKSLVSCYLQKVGPAKQMELTSFPKFLILASDALQILSQDCDQSFGPLLFQMLVDYPHCS